MPVVLNKRVSGDPTGAVYVGRPSAFGNPFFVDIHGTRSEVLTKYRRYLAENPALVARIKRELRGKDLVCWCAPYACHADILLEIANHE